MSDNLVRAAKVRALVEAHVRDDPIRIPDLFSNVLGKQMAELSVTYPTFSSIVNTMRKRGLIGATREGNTFLVYALKAGEESISQERPQKGFGEKPALSVVVNRTTKVVRLKIDGLIIDVSVQG